MREREDEPRMEDEPPIAVVGGGICGLTTTLALERRGLAVEVYEAADEYRPVGAGILLQTNALVAYEALGLAEEIRASGRPLADVEIRSPRGRVLQAFDLDVERESFGHGYVAIHRAELLEILRGALRSPIHTGKRCTGVSAPAEPTVRFDDGTRIRPGILIGADGIDSTVREAVSPTAERSLDTTVFRGVASVSLPERHRSVGFEVWGDGTYTGGAPIGRDRFYWFATAPAGLSETASLGVLRSHFAEYPDPVPAIVSALATDDLVTTELSDLPPVDRWHRGSTVLAGDAVHGMLPFAGQGAAQSIEDAVTLAAALDAHATAADAFASYEAERVERANRVRAESRRLGRLGTVQSAIACRLRNIAVATLPATIFERFRRRRVANASVDSIEGVEANPSAVRSAGEESV